MSPAGFTAAELARLGPEHLPEELLSRKHLIYSSPATLAFNSPGAEGFGVKRAGLAVPGSVMLIVAPGCCGRNTSLVSRIPGYENRFFYLTMDETDIVTGRHLKKIPQAVEEIIAFLDAKPSVVMICITCVDALLGTDMERVCRRAEERVGLPVRPCYMYALTREGSRPPMVQVRQSIFSLLQPKKKKGTTVNLLGYFAPLYDDSELYPLLRSVGVKTIHEISRCADFVEYLDMAAANFNLVLHPEARAAAQDFEKNLAIPSIELTRVYQPDRIHNQYLALGQVLGTELDDGEYLAKTRQRVQCFRQECGTPRLAVGESLNGDPFELALALTRFGMPVREVFGTLSGENFIYLRHLAELSPDTMVYSNMEPTMLFYDGGASDVQLTLGKDAGFYHAGCPNVPWNSDRQPFGYAGVCRLLDAMQDALGAKERI